MISMFATELGYMALATNGLEVLALTFGHSSSRVAERALRRLVGRCGPTGAAAATALDEDMQYRLTRFSLGELDDFQDVPVALGHLTDFQRHVVAACRAIEWGKTASYGELARHVGHPGAARAVGTVMSTNRVPLIIPCHRVLASGGKLGGYSAPQGLAMKKRLLELEQPAPLFA